MNKSKKNLFTILICIALIIVVVLEQHTSKANDLNLPGVGTNESILDDSDESGVLPKVSEVLPDTTSSPKPSMKEPDSPGRLPLDVPGTSVVEESSLEDYLNGKTLENADVEFYVSQPESNPETPAASGFTKIEFVLNNDEELYDKELPSGIYRDMLPNLQKFINENFEAPEEIKEVEIMKGTVVVSEEEKKLDYLCDLKNGYLLLVTVDLEDFEYSIRKGMFQKEE